MYASRFLRVFGAALFVASVMTGLRAYAQVYDFGTETPGADASGSPTPGAPGSDSPDGDLTLAYETAFPDLDDTDDSDLADLIEQTSQLRALEGRPTATLIGLTRRAEADMDRFATVLRSEGYYDGTASFAIDDAVAPAVVTVTVTPGSRYHLVAYDVDFTGREAPPGIELDPGLEIGMPARGRPIADAQTRLIGELRDQGRPFARVADRVAAIDRAAKTMTVTLTIDAGPPATFGPVAIEGLETLDPAFVRGKVPWREGERFDQSKLDALRTTLLGLGLFSSVKVEAAETVAADGRLPMTIALTEGLHRSIGAGAAYSTSEGFLFDLFWEHRNILGAAETLRLSGIVGTLTQRAVANFRKPDFGRVDQDLLADAALIQSNTDAFDETTATTFLGLERKLSERWRVAGGGSFELSRVEDQFAGETVQLFGTPLSAVRDNRDNVLHPTKGSVLGFDVTPYLGSAGDAISFAFGRVSGSAYLALDERRRIILAGRTRVASLVGEPTLSIPANKRLYAGGGGSIRGYEFQKVGPLDAENDPIGGRSLFEVGAELRLRVTPEIGIVPFVEGGNVFDDTVPDLTSRLQWGAGLGLRYHTAIGPARVDVAVPVNRRDNIDDRFQLYFSLGQAF